VGGTQIVVDAAVTPLDRQCHKPPVYPAGKWDKDKSIRLQSVLKTSFTIYFH
jgi:hypothetical protein